MLVGRILVYGKAFAAREHLVKVAQEKAAEHGANAVLLVDSKTDSNGVAGNVAVSLLLGFPTTPKTTSQTRFAAFDIDFSSPDAPPVRPPPPPKRRKPWKSNAR